MPIRRGRSTMALWQHTPPSRPIGCRPAVAADSVRHTFGPVACGRQAGVAVGLGVEGSQGAEGQVFPPEEDKPRDDEGKKEGGVHCDGDA